MRSIRFTRPEENTLLLSATAPPAHDADLQAAMDRLRQRLRRVLNVAGGPSVHVARILVMLFGYQGAPINNTAEGLRLLLSAPELNNMDWSTNMSFTPANGSSSNPPHLQWHLATLA